jgi:hypothetical protein
MTDGNILLYNVYAKSSALSKGSLTLAAFTRCKNACIPVPGSLLAKIKKGGVCFDGKEVTYDSGQESL